MSDYVRAYEGSEPYIFISYAHHDSEKVLSVIQKLSNLKYRIWYDEGIAPGSEWPLNIERHLQKASVVVAFVSKSFLSSKYCEKEVSRSISYDKKIIQITLDDVSKHEQLLGNETLEFDENLIEKLASILKEDLIGDGIKGYEYAIEKKKSFNAWNLVLGLAAMLAVIFFFSIYGLYNGRFDNWLPAKQPIIETVASAAEPQEAISINNSIIGSVVPVVFSSDKEKNAVYDLLGWEHPYEMTYNDLLEMEGVTHLEIENEPIKDISFAVYLPNLEVISLYSSHITDISSLHECPNLNTVQVTADMLPIILPEQRSFEVEII